MQEPTNDKRIFDQALKKIRTWVLDLVLYAIDA